MQYGNTSVATKPTNSVPANIYNKILLSGKSYFHTPSPLRGTPSLREASLSIFPKGARLEGELTRHSSVSRRKMSRRRLPL